ncbi:uncharacterized protein LOC116964358 [Tyto alba]|uniref:uncharacterized protein LOC116964358 n=1 Tax=Tyto alba TaxID=56313 RepID=UPI001C67511C|nr:uncharacterized protein LOC116964358 [Tyto alba]
MFLMETQTTRKPDTLSHSGGSTCHCNSLNQQDVRSTAPLPRCVVHGSLLVGLCFRKCSPAAERYWDGVRGLRGNHSLLDKAAITLVLFHPYPFLNRYLFSDLTLQPQGELFLRDLPSWTLIYLDEIQFCLQTLRWFFFFFLIHHHLAGHQTADTRANRCQTSNPAPKVLHSAATRLDVDDEEACCPGLEKEEVGSNREAFYRPVKTLCETDSAEAPRGTPACLLAAPQPPRRAVADPAARRAPCRTSPAAERPAGIASLLRPAPCCRTRRWRARWYSCPRTSPPPNFPPTAAPTTPARPWRPPARLSSPAAAAPPGGRPALPPRLGPV